MQITKITNIVLTVQSTIQTSTALYLTSPKENNIALVFMFLFFSSTLSNPIFITTKKSRFGLKSTILFKL